MSLRPAKADPSWREGDREGFVGARDGTQIFYRASGNGPAAVLCDGILCEGFIWKYLRTELSSSFRVVHWNYRGHGRSGRPRDRDGIGVRHHAEDLWRVADALGLERVALFGHSMGAQVCLEAYRAAQERTAGLGLLCGSYGRITRTFHGTDALAKLLPTLLEFCVRYPRAFRGMFAWTPSRLAVRVARLLREIDPIRVRAEDILPYFEHVASMDPELYLRMLDAAGRHSAEDMLRSVHVPTLVVAGERDTFTPPRLAEQMAEQIEGADFLFVPEGSHICLIEQPELINRAIERFLRERVYPAPDAVPTSSSSPSLDRR